MGRLHSIYNLKTNQIVENGIIDAEINNKHIFSEPSVTKLSSKYIRFIFYDLKSFMPASHILSKNMRLKKFAILALSKCRTNCKYPDIAEKLKVNENLPTN